MVRVLMIEVSWPHHLLKAPPPDTEKVFSPLVPEVLGHPASKNEEWWAMKCQSLLSNTKVMVQSSQREGRPRRVTTRVSKSGSGGGFMGLLAGLF